MPTLAEMLPFTVLGTWPVLLQPEAACAEGRRVCTQLRSIQPLPTAAPGVIGATRSFSRPPGDSLCQVCLFTDLRNPAAVMNKLLRKGVRAGDLAQGRAFCHCAQICACFVAALSPPPSHPRCGHSAGFIISLCIIQLSGSRNPFYQSIKAL